MEFIAANDIEHAEVVLSHFGYWPSFHNAEIVSMKFANDKEKGLAWMEMRIHAFEMTDELKGKQFELIKHCVIDIEFLNLGKSEIDGFNHQNAVLGLKFGKRDSFLFCEINPAYGAGGYIEAKKIRIHKLTLGIGSNI